MVYGGAQRFLLDLVIRGGGRGNARKCKFNLKMQILVGFSFPEIENVAFEVFPHRVEREKIGIF